MNKPSPQAHYEKIYTADGSPTLVHPGFKEAYSSVHGAWMQANELYLKLSQTHQTKNPKVLEVGFGLGMNFRATLQSAMERGEPLHYISYELFPLSKEVLASVVVPVSFLAQQIWSQLLEAWPSSGVQGPLSLCGQWGSLEIHFSDILTTNLAHHWATAIYLDPFSPEVNPEPWSVEVCQKLFGSATGQARLATYSVAGTVRRNLIAAGFVVERVKGVGKKHWLVARKQPESKTRAQEHRGCGS